MKWYTQDRETGTVIDNFKSKEVAEEAISQYEQSDKKNGNYTPNFYEIESEEIFAVVRESRGDEWTDYYSTKEDALFAAENEWVHMTDSEKTKCSYFSVARGVIKYDGVSEWFNTYETINDLKKEYNQLNNDAAETEDIDEDVDIEIEFNDDFTQGM